MSNPKFARRKVIINPVFNVPGNIEGVEYGEGDDVFFADRERDNSFLGPIRQESGPIKNNPNLPKPGQNDAVGQVIGKLIKQELIVTMTGELLVEVTFELPDDPGGYEMGISRV